MRQKQSIMMTILPQLIQALTETIQSLGYPEKEIKLSPPNNPEFGDLSTNLPLTLTKDLKLDPMVIAETIKDELNLSDANIDAITVTPPGFLNVKIGNTYYHQVLSEILENEQYGRGKSGEGLTANVCCIG